MLNKAAWSELEKWGVKKGEHPQHREAYILILSTNRDKNWWEHIIDPQQYFKKKYDKTINSLSCKKIKKKKGRKKKKKKTKKTKLIESAKMHKDNKLKGDEEDDDISMKLTDNDSVPHFITDAQFKSLREYGKNVFFAKKTAEGKGPILFKGCLPKMTPVTIEVFCCVFLYMFHLFCNRN